VRNDPRLQKNYPVHFINPQNFIVIREMNVSIISEEFLQQNWHFPLKKKAKNLSLNHPVSIVSVFIFGPRASCWSTVCFWRLQTAVEVISKHRVHGLKEDTCVLLLTIKEIVRYRIRRAKTLLRCISSSSSTFPIESFEKKPPLSPLELWIVHHLYPF